MTSDDKIRDEKAKFTYSSLGKALKKQIKTVEDQREKQIKGFKEHKKQPKFNEKKRIIVFK